MAEPKARFESFSQHFWTEENKETFEYALFLTSSSKKTPYTIDDAIFDWLFQLWEPNVYLVVGQEKITVFYSSNNANDLSDLKRLSNIELRNNQDNETDLAKEVCEFIGSSKTAITDNLAEESNISSLSTSNVQKEIEEILIVHEKSEQTRCRNASKIADRAIRKVLEKNLVSILQDHEPMECDEFSHTIIGDLNNPDLVNLRFSPNEVSPAFPPAIQCGHNINVSFPPENIGGIPPNIFNIAVSSTIAIRFKSYIGAIGRTYLINATDEQKKAYKAVIKAREQCFKAIKIGAKYSDIYNEFKDNLDSDYQKYIPESIGTFAGIQIYTKYHQITADSEEEVKPNTMLILIFGLNEFPAESEDKSMENKFSFQVTDTFQVGETEEEIKLLSTTSAHYEDVAYSLDTTDSKKLQEELLNDNTNMAERTRHHNQSNTQKIDEENKKIYDDLRQRTRPIRGKTDDNVGAEIVHVSYKSEKEVHNLKDSTNQISVAEENTKTVFLPIYGVMVPFHVSKIKQANEEDIDDNKSYLKIKFETPKADSKAIDPSIIYIQEVQFVTKGNKKFSGIAKKIRDLMAQYKAELKKKKDEKGLYRTNEKLDRLENNFPRIGGSNLHIRPVLNGKKSVGNLEAHKNAFRFRSTVGDSVVLFYSNIRLAVFQRSRKETITLIHFYLDRPIMISNKPTLNITFYKQVVESAVDTSVRSSSMTDQGEMAEEEREDRIRKKINNEFTEFCKAVNTLHDTYNAIKIFERPIRKLGFYGVPDKSRIFLMPTVSALVSVQEQPPYVLMIEDIQIAIFEHKDIGMRTFDLTFILFGWEDADFQNSISQITTIDDEYFEIIKGWIEAIGIKFYVRKSNINWKKLMPEMKKNKQDYKTDEDWNEFLAEPESEDEDEDPDNTDDQAFVEDEEDEDDDDDEEFDEDEPDTDEDDAVPEEDESNSDTEAYWKKQDEAAKSYDSRHSKRFDDDDDDDSSSRKKHKSDKSSKKSEHHHHHHSKH